jgi:hypothetical protein
VSASLRVSVLIALAVVSCSGAGGEASSSASDVILPPTFGNVYTSVIARRCTPCHTVPGEIGITDGKLDMTSQAAAYADLVGTEAAGVSCGGKGLRVAPGSPTDSIMYLKTDLTDPAPCGSKMPLGGPPLSAADVALIQAWISAGAQND